MKRIKEYFIDVFSRELGFTICIWVLSSAPAIWYYYSVSKFEIALSFAIKGLFVAFLVSFFCCLFKGKARKWSQTIFMILGIINVCVDKFVYNVTHYEFCDDTVSIILGSNISESNEFLSIYVTDKILIFSAASILLASFFLVIKKEIARIPIKIILPICILLFLFCLTELRDSKYLKSVFVMKTILFAQYEKPKDLSLYRQTPDICINENQPDNVVIILGESLSASFCSLYGYEKQTEPRLSQLSDQGSIVVYDNVLSADLSTIPSFKKMMSTYSENDDDEWYTHMTIFDIVKQGDYHINWISNQSPTGVYDNIVTSFAKLSDTLVWCGTTELGISKHDLDEIVLPEIQDQLYNIGNSQSLWFIHLMGSHEEFSLRYPEEFSVFSSEDYSQFPENQRSIRAAYDNSVLYNDYVVSEIMESFNGTEAVIIYISDHGLDIYGSDSTYYGHARKNDFASVKAAQKVPFLVFGTKEYRTNFPIDWATICKSANGTSSYNLENLMFTIMDLCNISLADSTQMGPSIFDQN